MPSRLITFEPPAFAVGQLRDFTYDGITVRLLGGYGADVYRPAAVTSSGAYALRNSSQDRADEFGALKPMIMEFNYLQRRVRMAVGLEETDLSTPNVVAELSAYDSSGNRVAAAAVALGPGPTPITTPLEVIAGGDVIQRVVLTYSGNGQEMIDDLELESDSVVPAGPDTIAPVVHIAVPTQGQRVNSRSIFVQGRVVELHQTTMTVNGTPAAPRRVGVEDWDFDARIELPIGATRVLAQAVDESGNAGEASVDVVVLEPSEIQLSDVRFTQTGVMDGVPTMPRRLVAGKTSLYRIKCDIKTADGQPSWVTGASLTMTSAGGSHTYGGMSPDGLGGFRTGVVQDGTEVHFFVDGRHLQAGVPYSFTVRVGAHEERLATDLLFRPTGGVTMLLVPQHRSLTPAYVQYLLRALSAFGRMYPVADGLADIDSDSPGGIRFKLLPPTDYTGHTDPTDGVRGRIQYDQGFVMHDHIVGHAPGPDAMIGTADDVNSLWSGEYICTNLTYPEDSDRGGGFDPEDLARVLPVDGPNDIIQRVTNWSMFSRTSAESARQSFNRGRPDHFDHHAARAVIILTGGYGPAGTHRQNRTSWAGNAGNGETAFWAQLDNSDYGFIPHEVGHTFGLDHSAVCQLAGDAVDLLDRRIITQPSEVMCATLGPGTSNLFLNPDAYDLIFDRLTRQADR